MVAATDNAGPLHRIALGHRDATVPPAFVLPFDTASFDPGDFARHRVPRPESILRSVPKRQAEYLAGRRAALAALHAAGSDATDIPIGPDRGPRWPPGFIGSVSHADGLAMAVALRADVVHTGIGLDVEHVIADAQLGAVRDLVLDEREMAYLEPVATTLGWAMVLTLAFSAKESFFKATAPIVGRFFDFDALRIVGVDAPARRIDAEVVDTLADRLTAGRRFALPWVSIDDGTVLTSCAW